MEQLTPTSAACVPITLDLRKRETIYTILKNILSLNVLQDSTKLRILTKLTKIAIFLDDAFAFIWNEQT